MWFGFWTWNLSFSSLSLFFFYCICHLSSPVYSFFDLFLSRIPFLCSRPGVWPKTLWRKQPLSSMFSFAICFVSIFVSIAGDKTAAVWFDRRHQFALLPTLSGFSLSPSKASPSISLFFLNVIVKCSSEMTLNMCTLTEGIHLVIYFLIPVSRCLSLVSLSFYLLRFYPMKRRSVLEVFYKSKWKSRILFYAWKRLILVLWTGEFLPGAVSDFLTGREHGRAACEAKPRGFGAPPLSSEITTPQPCECWVNWQARENHL